MTCDWEYSQDPQARPQAAYDALTGTRRRVTEPVWVKVSQTAGQAQELASVMAMLRTIESFVANRTGVDLTIAELRDAGVYTVTQDDGWVRYEVFAPFGIEYTPRARG